MHPRGPFYAYFIAKIAFSPTGPLEGMYNMAVNHFRPATDSTGAWNWYGGKPTNPTGQLALLAYDSVTHLAYVVAISEQINTSAW